MTNDTPTFGTHLEKVDGDTKVQIEWIGEGRDGDWIQDEADDYPHLRFGVQRMVDGDWIDVEDTSYCCQVDARCDEETKVLLADRILDAVRGEMQLKRICQGLSWLSADDLTSAPAPGA